LWLELRLSPVWFSSSSRGTLVTRTPERALLRTYSGPIDKTHLAFFKDPLPRPLLLPRPLSPSIQNNRRWVSVPALRTAGAVRCFARLNMLVFVCHWNLLLENSIVKHPVKTSIKNLCDVMRTHCWRWHTMTPCIQLFFF